MGRTNGQENTKNRHTHTELLRTDGEVGMSKKKQEDEWDDYDYCYECRGLGDDYIFNDDGELESWCDHCGLNPNGTVDD